MLRSTGRVRRYEMKPRLVKFGVAAAAAIGGFLLQQILSNKGGQSRSSSAQTADRLKGATAKPVQKVEELSQDGGEMLADLGRRVSSRVGGDEDRQEDESERQLSNQTLDELAARRREREERRRKRSSAG
jgi:hypothetical protein